MKFSKRQIHQKRRIENWSLWNRMFSGTGSYVLEPRFLILTVQNSDCSTMDFLRGIFVIWEPLILAERYNMLEGDFIVEMVYFIFKSLTKNYSFDEKKVWIILLRQFGSLLLTMLCASSGLDVKSICTCAPCCYLR